jgi:hypothetical protein
VVLEEELVLVLGLVVLTVAVNDVVENGVGSATHFH